MRDLWWLMLFLVVVAVRVSVVYCDFPLTVLPLERAFPLDQRVELSELAARDRVRHSRLLQGASVGGIVNFPVEGSSDPLLVGSHLPLLYYTKVKLGSPPREFNVQIDTGSDILWVTCSSCSNCPHSSGLGIEVNFFDPATSSTVGLVSCSDRLCSSAVQTTAAQCSQSNQCSYSFRYGDGSGTSGIYITDAFSFDAMLGNSVVANSSAPIIFGCSTYQSGDLTKSDKAVDGIFGFGQGDMSVVSQLSSRGITPRVFSHCLKGLGSGGGIFVLGQIMAHDMVYSPLVPSQPHYNLNLLSIAVNGQILPIDPAVFETSNNRGTIVDTGTTLTYLVEEAYDSFVNAITTIVSQSVTPTVSKGIQCYYVSNGVNEVFPPLSFNFAGGASMILRPDEYLVPSASGEAVEMWCIGFQRVQSGITILGDLVLKDKVFVYDLARQRIGWANYDCSMSVNVSVTSGKDLVSAGHRDASSSSNQTLLRLLSCLLATLFMHLFFSMELRGVS